MVGLKAESKASSQPSLSSILGSLCALKGGAVGRAGRHGHQLRPVAHLLFRLTHAMDHRNTSDSKTKVFMTLYLQTSIALLFASFWKLHSLQYYPILAAFTQCSLSFIPGSHPPPLPPAPQVHTHFIEHLFSLTALSKRGKEADKSQTELRVLERIGCVHWGCSLA